MNGMGIQLKVFLINCGKNHEHIAQALECIQPEILDEAFLLTSKDAVYHFPSLEMQEVYDRIVTNCNELGIFLYRTGRLIYLNDPLAKALKAIHFLMRSMCSCEIYYSTDIAEGFYIVHGVGTVIGSRHVIGKGFKIYQNCTIGHVAPGGKGCRIGDDVTLYANASILGECSIGNNVKIGAYSLVLQNVPANSICRGIPAQIFLGR